MPAYDVLVIGAGAAGLTAARDLVSANRKVLILEGRTRIGGRILTEHRPDLPIAIELGAEFVHGRPPEIFELAEVHSLDIIELQGHRWYSDHGRVGLCDDFFEDVDNVFQEMNADGVDESFVEFLERSNASDSAKQWAVEFVEGFNAARRQRISVHSLVQSNRASEDLEGDRLFRIKTGYDQLIRILADGLDIRTSAAVQQIRWRRGDVTVHTTAGQFIAPHAIVTVPLPVLADLQFEPELSSKREAAGYLEMGEVVRITIRFREAFWEERTREMMMLLSHDEVMPTWWSTRPVRAPLLTGWAAGRRGRNLSALGADAVCERAIAALGRILGEHPRELMPFVSEYFVHDWQSDPFSRGAYSYIRPGGMHAPAELARPVENTLFFAGEATDTEGHGGTVHGAIQTGHRAAQEVLETPSPPSRSYT